MQPLEARSHAEKILQSTRNNSREDPLWRQAEEQLLTAVILHIKDQSGNFQSLIEVLKQSPEELEQCLENSSCDAARQEFATFKTNCSVNFRIGVHSGLLAQLQSSWLKS